MSAAVLKKKKEIGRQKKRVSYNQKDDTSDIHVSEKTDKALIANAFFVFRWQEIE